MPQPSASSPPRRRLLPSRPRRPLVSLTALIDVVFILLVFFMLASSFLDWRGLELATPAPAGRGGGVEGTLLVRVGPGGAVDLAGMSVDVSDLSDALSARLAADPGRAVTVLAAAGVTLQQLVTVIDRVDAAGATAVSLARAGVRP